MIRVAFFRKQDREPASASIDSQLRDPRWLHALELHRQLQRAEEEDVLSTRAWNKLVDQHDAAVRDMVTDSALVDAIWDLLIDEASESQAASEILRASLGASLDALGAPPLHDHPALRVSSGDLEVEPAVLLVEKHPVELERDFWDEERRPSLSRIGGFPTRVEGRPLPDGDFLLQLDLTDLEPGWSDTDVEEVLALYPSLPQGGLLQVFGRTDTDSSTAPDSPGGGVTIVHLGEDDLVLSNRLPHPRSDHAARQLVPVARPTVRPRADTDETLLFKAHWLNDTINAAVPAESDNGFDNVVAPIASRLFGLQVLDFDVAGEDLEILQKKLPLAGPDDYHLLFLQVSSLGVLDECFGDSGFLEIWLRESDLRAGRFEHVVSFIRAT